MTHPIVERCLRKGIRPCEQCQTYHRTMTRSLHCEACQNDLKFKQFIPRGTN